MKLYVKSLRWNSEFQAFGLERCNLFISAAAARRPGLRLAESASAYRRCLSRCWAPKRLCNLKAFAREALEQTRRISRSQGTRVRKKIENSSKKLASMLDGEYVCVKVGNPLLTLLRNSKIA